jgi:TolB-like protein/DNA-binding winged helix-turn-helix (wHTH) protein/Flp pilus assembly protein TadD
MGNGITARSRVPLRVIRFGPFEFQPATGELRKHGLRVKLRGQPIELLTMLLQRPGEPVTREELQRLLWPADTYVDFEHSLNAAIKRLRAALGDSADAPRFIETLAGRGYRFIAPVSQPAEEAPQIAPTAAANGKPEPEPEAKLAARRRPGLWIAAAASFVLLILLAMNFARLREVVRGRTSPGPIRSLVVLPLANLSGDPDQDYFVEGMTDALRQHLEGVGSLRIISRTSSIHYRGSAKPLPDIARELNVDAVVDGSVLRSGDRVRINVELIHAGVDRHLWSNSYERDLRDVFVLQAEVARRIAEEIRVTLTPHDRAQLARVRNSDPEAYRAYSNGRVFWNKRNEQDLKKAIGFFQLALDRDPDYALAYDGLADSWLPLGWYGFVPPSEAFPQARAAITKALGLDDSMAETHTSLAFVNMYYDRDWAGAEREFRRAIELNPNYANGHHWYGEYLSLVGRHAEAIAESQRARELDPLSNIINAWVSSRYFFARQYDKAIEEGRNAVQVDPGFGPAHLVLGHAYEQKGMLREAVTEFETASRLAAGSMYSASLAHALVGAGRRSEALNLLEVLRTTAERRFVSSYDLAICEMGMGNKEQTFDLLNAAVQEHSPRVAFIGVEPRFDELRADQRFAALLRSLGLQSEASPAFPEAQSHRLEHRP